MLGWPFYDVTLFFLPLFAVGGVAAAVQAYFMWMAIREESRNPPETVFHSAPSDKEPHSPLAAGITTFAAVIFTLTGILGTFFVGTGKYQFRQLPVDRLAAIDVFPADGEYKVHSSWTIRIENTNGRLTSAFALLRRCGELSRQHEHFEDGYVLRLVFDDPKFADYYVSVFRRSSASPHKSLVMPQRELVRNTNLGEYACPEFQEWIKQNIDPLFQSSN